MTTPESLDTTDVIGRRTAVRALAAQRLLATVTFTAIVVVQHRGVPGVLWVIAPIAFVWELSTFILLRGPRWQQLSTFWLIVVDLVILCAGIFISGRSSSDLLLPSLIVIPATSYTFSTRQVVELTALVLVAGLIPISVDIANHVHMAARHLLLFVLPGMLAMSIVIVFTRVSQEMAARLAALSSERRVLLVERIARDDAERARIAQRIHDDALQTLLSVSQDLDEAAAGDAGALDEGRVTVRRGIDSLHDAVQRLHPESLAGTELGITLPALLERTRAQHGIAGEAHVAPGLADRSDERLYRIARELIDNACRHASAARIDVTLEDPGERVVLRVCDDGIGYQPPPRGELVAGGRLGLASLFEQVESAGGTLEFRAGPDGHGTEARASLPRAS